MNPIKQLHLYLIKPSKYDDEGYVIRHWKGVLPSNTLACLYGLTEDVRKRGALGPNLKWRIENIDETVERVDVEGILRRSRSKERKTIVCLVGVQSNQFPRAADLALAFHRAGIEVLIGGFHVSGVFATLEKPSLEIQELCDAGVSVVAGEVEGRWEGILRDALNNNLKRVYNFLEEAPDLSDAPMPKIPENLVNHYAVRHFATLDCGRGCPFACTFCTVINVQGRVMRYRPVESIINLLRENFLKHDIRYYFFTDDNFSRNKNWHPIFDALAKMRTEEKISIHFMMQVDTLSHQIPDFVEKAKEAGCSQVFIGVESINEENLEAAGKRQNKVKDFKAMLDKYQAAGIAAHMAYIIGFPFDSRESVARDIERLQIEFSAKQASFFMLTPLPGSMDHKTAILRGTMLDADLNNFDSFHETFRHSRMPAGDWTAAYNAAWSEFYSTQNMIRILKQTPARKYWDVFLNFIWYKNAIQVEGGHPMLNGFFRQKSRTERRPSFPQEGRLTFFKRRAREISRSLVGWGRMIFEMEEVWLATRRRSPLEEAVVSELKSLRKRAIEWRTLRLADLQAIYRNAVSSLEIGWNNVPSRFRLGLSQWNVFTDSLTDSRVPMSRFWKAMFKRIKRGKVLRPMPFHQIAIMTFREVVLFLKFMASLLKGVGIFAKE